MFGKRHRRSQEQEPLVPHGLVWQAMEATAPAENPEVEVEGLSSSAEPLENVPPPAKVPACEPQVQVSGATADLAEPDWDGNRIPFWHRLANPKIVKPATHGDGLTIPPPRSNPVVTTGDRSPRRRPSRTVDLVRHQASRVNTASRRFAATMRELSDRVDMKALVSNSRKLAGEVIQWGLAVLARVRARILERRPWEGLKQRVGGICSLALAGAQNVSVKAQHGYRELRLRSQGRFSKSLPEVHPDTTSAALPGGTFDLPPITRQRQKPRTLIGLPLKVWVALKTFLPQKGTFHAMRRDSRLWTSFAMAGLSALLLLGFVSTVKHYATEALPSHVLRNNSSAERVPAETAGIAPQKTASQVEPVRTPQRDAMTSPKRRAAPRVARPKPRGKEDDDYVARDTFVSYENRRNSSR